jgi:GT2 family glycosyltransferase
MVLAATLRSLKTQDYPGERFEVVVVADNCTDATAQIARDHGAVVLERVNARERGKGYALDWALAQLLAQPAPAEAFVIVDADTWVEPGFLTIMASRLYPESSERGCRALQGRYGVLNRQEGWRAALMAAAFDLYNHVKPLGRDRLGLSVGLKGNGMAFTRAVLERARWRGHSVTEDIDYGLDLLRHHGIRVRYVPEARVLAQMPTTGAGVATQRDRWEAGRYRLLRERALPLLLEGLRGRDLRLCDAALDLLLPPLAELTALLCLWAAMIALGQVTHLLSDSPGWWGPWAVSALGLLLYLFGGLKVADAPRQAYRALLQAPCYVLWKFALYAGRVVGRPSRTPAAASEWVRTARVPIATATAPEQAKVPSVPESPVL